MTSSRRSLSAEEFLTGPPPGEDAVLEGAALLRVYWTIRGREKEEARQRAFWWATNEAVAGAYEELERTTAELDRARAELVELNQQLEQRVEEQVQEIVARARDVEVLNAQLRLQVQARSRDLAAALRRLAEQAPKVGALPAGTVVAGRAQIVRLLGRGGMGEVYLAEDLASNEKVALKVLTAVPEGESSIRRFLAEAAAAAAISHPAVVRTLAVDLTDEGHVYQLLEYVEGQTLAAHLTRGRLDVGIAARLGAVVADGLAAAHAQGVVHRDIKPANIMIGSRPPGVLILDFGLAKAIAEDSVLVDQRTRAGVFMGTPQYVAPEQARDAQGVGAASDVYSLGITLFEAISGSLPFSAGNLEGYLVQHIVSEPPDLRTLRAEVPDDLAVIIGRCLSKMPKARPDAALLAATLASIADRLGAPDSREIKAILEEAVLESEEGLTVASAEASVKSSIATVAQSSRQRDPKRR